MKDLVPRRSFALPFDEVLAVPDAVARTEATQAGVIVLAGVCHTCVSVEVTTDLISLLEGAFP